MNRSEPRHGPVKTASSPYSRLAVLPIDSVRFPYGFWQQRQQINCHASLQHGYEMLQKTGAIENFKRCAGLADGPHMQLNGHDSDVYKWLEAAAWELARQPDDQLAAYVNEIVPLIAAAQAEDGYLNIRYQMDEPDHRWTDLDFGHEMYTAGHLFQAAVALTRATGDTRLLHVARRFADHIDSVFGPGKRPGTCGHPQIEAALVELYRETGEVRYLNLAQFLVDERGNKRLSGMASYGPEYHQDHAPVREVHEAVGHAVRLLYLAAGITDLYLETGETILLERMLDLWGDITSSKIHISGGVGARYDGEAFGDPYELPTDQSYCETCAAIANVFWNWRMLLACHDSRFADSIEQALYNAILCSPSLDGKRFVYVNPLMLRDTRFLRLSTNRPDDEDPADGRPAWHRVACCPPNVMRLFASLEHYFASQDQFGLQIHQYGPMTIQTDLPSGKVSLDLATKYPWEGEVTICVTQTPSMPWRLQLRLPGWCKHWQFTINNQATEIRPDSHGYLNIEREWRSGDRLVFTMQLALTWMAANPRADALRACVALQRGPILYCLEYCDQPEEVDLLDVAADYRKTPQEEWMPDLLDGVTVLHFDGYIVDPTAWGMELYRPLHRTGATSTSGKVHLTAIPYYAWGNRRLKTMRVWIPTVTTSPGEIIE
jgi:uncharacterized protein